MKKNLTALILFLTCTFYFSQQVKELNGKYFINMDKFLFGEGIIELNEYINFPLFSKYKELKQNKKRSEAEEYVEEAFKAKIFIPEEGQYYLNSDEDNFQFTIDDKKQFSGIGEASMIDGGKERFKFYFQSGQAIKTEVRNNEGLLLRILERNDSVFTENIYVGGKLAEKSMRPNNSRYTTMYISYFGNGNVESDENYVSKIYKRYYPNGIPETFKNEITNESIKYDDLGRKEEHFYNKAVGERCKEWYKNGLLSYQSCKNSEHKTEKQSTYKEGKLDSYLIIDTKKGDTKKYNSDNKLILTEKLVVGELIVLPKAK